jgi:hypothetical protein
VRALQDSLQELRMQSAAEVKYMRKAASVRLGIAQKDIDHRSKVWVPGKQSRAAAPLTTRP